MKQSGARSQQVGRGLAEAGKIGSQHDAVAIRPLWIGRIEPQMPSHEDRQDRAKRIGLVRPLCVLQAVAKRCRKTLDRRPPLGLRRPLDLVHLLTHHGRPAVPKRQRRAGRLRPTGWSVT